MPVGRTGRKHNSVRTLERRERLAQAARRQELVAKIIGSEEHNVKVAKQGAVLKAVVEKMQLRLEFLFRDETGFVAALADNDGDAQTVSDQNWFVAVFRGGAFRVNHQHAARLAAVAAGENVETDAASLQQLAKSNHKRSFSRAARRQAADADDWLVEPPRQKYAAIKQRIPQRADAAVETGERVYAAPPRARLAVMS
jgi:hypothetical protein